MSNDGTLRIVFLIPKLEVGGAERVVLRTAGALDRSRFTPTVVVAGQGNGTLAGELAAAGVQTVVLDRVSHPRLRQFYRLVRWLQSNRPDVLLTFMFHANLAGRLVRRLGIVPALVCSERIMKWDSRFRVLVNRYTVSWADGVTVNSSASRRSWARDLRIPESRISVIYNGVDTTTFVPGQPVSPPVIGVLARLHGRNGHDWFLDALAQLDERAPQPWTCAFAGTGPEEPMLRAKVATLGLHDRVTFLGHVADPTAFLRSLMLCAHPARASGMPNAVLEAMACGLPVIATAVGGTPEAIEHGKTGWLVQPDDADSTAALLAELLRTPATRQAVGARARTSVVKRFSVEAMVAGTETMITQLLERQTPAAV